MTPREALDQALAGRYTIGAEIGRGGSATVYLAEDLKHRRRVAIKVLRAELSSALGGERFTREIEIVAPLSHPHILPLHDSGEAGGVLYYVMPFVDGETLRSRLKRESRLPVEDAVRILREVVDALAFAHQHGVVHRDIKPENIMLSGRHAIVMDFGVAKAVSAATGEALTTMGLALGTPAYMAPEQAMGESTVDHRADIYAVGVLAYEMLAGAPPFVRATSQATLSAHVMETPAELTSQRSDVTSEFNDVVMKCLEKDPAHRFETAEAMLPFLAPAMTPSGGIARTTARPTRITRPGRGRLRYAAAAAIVFVILLGAGWRFLWSGAGDGINQIAVLPVRDISGADAVFVDSLHDAMISALARLNVANVVPRSEVMSFMSGASSTANVARTVRADAILESTVFRDGDRIRLNLQLVEPAGLRHLWAETYERNVADVLNLHREIGELIAAEIQKALHPSASTRPSKESPSS